MAAITVLGAGAWGTALAIRLALNGHSVRLAARREAQITRLSSAGQNRSYLPDVAFPRDLQIVAMTGAAVAEARVIVVAVPSPFARSTLLPLIPAIPADTILVSVVKGVERDSLLTMSQMLSGLAPPAARIGALSGPGFAAEVARGQPAALVAAAFDEDVARRVQQLFACRTLRIYRSRDVIGVELGGAVKNVIAIAAGISDGLALGSGARAALITRGLAEMMRLAAALGAQRETLAGLAGLGDLVLTCCGDLSRNRRWGLALARGETVPELTEGKAVAEGVLNAASICRLADKFGVEMPIVAAVRRILYDGAPANAMVEALLNRELKAEF